jgi:hypothetical protein
MTGSSIQNVVIVVVVVTGDCVGDPPATTPAEARTRQEHAQDDSGQPPDTHPPGAPEDDVE